MKRRVMKLDQIVHDLISRNINVVLPNIVLIEVASAITRRTKSKKMAISSFKVLKSIPNFNFINIDGELAEYCSNIAIEAKLKSLDTIILSTALMYNSDLITFDKQLNTAYSQITK